MSKLAINHKKPLSMTSQEIAELTGKRHDHVMRDIRSMVTQLKEAKSTAPNLGWYCESSTYTDKKGELRQCYLLDYNTTVNLLTGYDAVKRMMVIQRWQELEAGSQVALPTNYIEALERLIISEREKQQLINEKKQLEEKNKEVTNNFNVAMGTVAKQGDTLFYLARVMDSQEEDRHELLHTYRSA